MQTVPPGDRRSIPEDERNLNEYIRDLDAEDETQASISSALATAVDYTLFSLNALCKIADLGATYWKDIEPMREHAHVCMDLFQRFPEAPSYGNEEEEAKR